MSDIGGIGAGNPDNLFTTLIENFPPTSPGGISSGISDRTACPSITGPIATGAGSVSGTSSEATGTSIKVYKNGVLIGTTTVSAGAWTLGSISPALATADVITASATASGKAESISNCDITTVGAVCTPPVTSAAHCGKSIQGLGTTGAKIRVYQGSNTTADVPTAGTVFTTGQPVTAATLPSTLTPTTDNFLHKCTGSGANTACSSSGGACLINGAYRITQQSGTQCESDPVWICVGGLAATATPTISTSITNLTTSVSGTVPSPENIAGVHVYLYKNGTQIGSTTTAAGGTWTISSLSFSACDLVKAIAIKNTATAKCPSAYSATSTVTGGASAAPSISGTYCTTTSITSVSGTSTEADGTTIQVYENGVAEGSATTVTSGAWTASTGISIVAGSTITAKATNSAACETISAASAGVVVGSKSTNAVVISGTITEGNTSVSGTGTNGDIIRLYIDGTAIGGTATVAGGAWTISGLSSSTLYAGGSLTATAQTGALCEGSASAAKTVQCILPLSSPSLNPTAVDICLGQTTAAQLSSTESGVIYQFYNGASPSGISMVGTGSTITLTSAALTSSTSLTIKGTKISPAGCINTLTATLTVTVNPLSTCDKDGDGVQDIADLDSDNDGVPNELETAGLAFLPLEDDDLDGILNYADANGWSHCCAPDPGFPAWLDADGNDMNDHFSSDSDAQPDFFDFDSDNDGITDCVEAGGIDANGDGIIDGFSDGDSDGLATSVDPNNGGTSLPIPDTDGDGVKDYRDVDCDNDGIPDLRENLGADTDHNGYLDVFADTDTDGLADALDPNNGGTPMAVLNTDLNPMPNYRDLDSDNDGLFDLREADVSIPGTDLDPDGNGKINTITDADGNGLDDGRVSTPFSYPNTDGTGNYDFLDTDSDGDGEPDYIEAFDDDNSGLSNADYIARGVATGIGIYANTDDDGDGKPNYLEDADADGIPNFLDVDNGTYFLDSDADGVIDLFDINSSGANATKPFPDLNGNGTPSFREVLEVVPLPIELLDFKGKSVKQGHLIQWSTASEQNNDYFTLEYSINNQVFQAIHTQDGAGQSNALRAYEFLNQKLEASPVHYYRLKQTDFDGKSKYSSSIYLKSIRKGSFEITQAYQTSSQELRVELQLEQDQTIFLQLINGAGSVILSQQLFVSKDQPVFLLTTGTLPSGTYYLHCKDSREGQAIRTLILK